MRKLACFLLTLLCVSGPISALDTSCFLPRTPFEPNGAEEVGSSRDSVLLPSAYDYVTFEGVSAHVHVYGDCLVITIDTGVDKGMQGIHDFQGELLAGKAGPDAVQDVNGTVFDVYDYGGGAVFHAGYPQFFYVY